MNYERKSGFLKNEVQSSNNFRPSQAFPEKNKTNIALKIRH